MLSEMQVVKDKIINENVVKDFSYAMHFLEFLPKEDPAPNSVVEEYLQEKRKYEDKRKQQPKKGVSREDQTLALLDRFKTKLTQAIEETPENELSEPDVDNDEGCDRDSGTKCTPRTSTDDRKLSSAGDTTERWDAIQGHLDKLEKRVHVNVIKFNKAKGVLERPKLLDYRNSLYATLNMTTTCQQLAYGSDPVHGSHTSKAEGLRMSHVLQFEDRSRKVKDASMQDEDTFEIYDPRNPVTKRRREESKKIMREKKERR
ncbi:hypothetical protein DUI87_18921 [Hirundo rustica rustica]|uniref:Uncharacterized protein n=1 Tax=Hirundo rustica rustica TaxID=333673 RepID=A0A3M0JTV7_HIRRU|nr:hypothetical protein DUI87_18921 [Hirundo rustica rustica]